MRKTQIWITRAEMLQMLQGILLWPEIESRQTMLTSHDGQEKNEGSVFIEGRVEGVMDRREQKHSRSWTGEGSFLGWILSGVGTLTVLAWIYFAFLI